MPLPTAGELIAEKRQPLVSVEPLFLPVFPSLIPQMIVPYADAAAAALMLANLDRGGPMARQRN